MVPFIAGSNKISWQRFSFYSVIGLLLSVGQFVLWGDLLSYGLTKSSLLGETKIVIVEHQYSLMAVAVSMLFLYVGFKRKIRFLIAKTLTIFLVAMLAVNYSHFFGFSGDLKLQTTAPEENNAFITMEDITFKAYPGKSAFFNAQAINVMYIGDSPKPLMSQLGWIKNKTFSRDELKFGDYIDLIKANTPPVSDLFWNNRPQHLAFQQPGNLMQRSHIRWWNNGIDPQTHQTVWLGAISYDNGLALIPYSGILTVLHSVDPNVDDERDKLVAQIESVMPNKILQLVDLNMPVSLDEQHDYHTDGKVLVINEKVETAT